MNRQREAIGAAGRRTLATGRSACANEASPSSTRATTGPRPTDSLLLTASIDSNPAAPIVFALGAACRGQNRRKRRDRQRRAPQCGLVVNDGPAGQEQRHGARPQRERQHERAVSLSFGDSLTASEKRSHSPLQPSAAEQQYGQGKEHRELCQPPVEMMGDEQHGKPENGGDETEVHVRTPVDDEPLETHAAGWHREVAVQQCPALDVVERAKETHLVPQAQMTEAQQ